MRTGTGVIYTVCDNGLVKIRTNRDNLYTPCSDKMCSDNVLIDAKNPVGAIKGQFVKFNIPDEKMGAGGLMCFGMPTLQVIIWGAAGYWLGVQHGFAGELTAFAGMIGGGILAVLLLKQYERKLRQQNTMAEITDILVDKTNEMEDL